MTCGRHGMESEAYTNVNNVPSGPATWAVDLAVAGVAMSWGMNHVVVKHALKSFNPLAFDALRLTMASMLLMGLLWLLERDVRLQPPDLRLAVLIGVVGHGLYQTLFILGINLTSAGKTSIILALSPVPVAFLNQMMGRERYTWRTWAGIAGSVAGVLLVTAGGIGSTRAGQTGDLVILAATLCWAVYTVLTAPLLARYSPLKVTAVTMTFGAAVMMVYSLPSLLRQDWRAIGASSWAAFTFSCTIPIGIGYVIWSWGIKRIGGTRTMVYSNLSPMVSSLMGWVILGETWAPAQVMGALLVILGVSAVKVGAVSAAIAGPSTGLDPSTTESPDTGSSESSE